MLGPLPLSGVTRDVWERQPVAMAVASDSGGM